jgi:hypothetical protein
VSGNLVIFDEGLAKIDGDITAGRTRGSKSRGLVTEKATVGSFVGNLLADGKASFTHREGGTNFSGLQTYGALYSALSSLLPNVNDVLGSFSGGAIEGSSGPNATLRIFGAARRNSATEIWIPQVSMQGDGDLNAGNIILTSGGSQTATWAVSW